MSVDAPTQLAPGIHRLGNEYVNCYLLEEGNDLTLVDGGLPGFRPQLDAYLQSRGRSVKDITAVILTHAHADHVGIVEHVREDTQAPVYVHAKDAEMARTGKTHKRDGSMLPYLRYPALYKLFLVAGRAGGARTPNVEVVTTFDAEQDLDVPGRPRIIPTPGHSPGHVAFHLPEQGVADRRRRAVHLQPAHGRQGPAADAAGVRRGLAADATEPGSDRAHRRHAHALRPRRAVDGVTAGRGRSST